MEGCMWRDVTATQVQLQRRSIVGAHELVMKMQIIAVRYENGTTLVLVRR